MGQIAEMVEEQLERLVTMVPEARVHRLEQRKGGAARDILPFGIEVDTSQPRPSHVPLPALSMVVDSRKVNLDFLPAGKEDNYWMNLYVAATSPCKIQITAAATGLYTAAAGGRTPLQPYRTGDPEFDAAYEVMSADLERARQLLGDAASRRHILDMGEIEKFTVAPRYLHLVRLVDTFQDVEAQGLLRTIREMAALARIIEERLAAAAP
ncbi:MAG TPA: hypothetical protein VNO81_13790 [Candidatus Nitrosotenuis sp.]|jgi:hypothetical protein|nr:hypothetical protein [Candidatus Nitrosotenuis sp.]